MNGVPTLPVQGPLVVPEGARRTVRLAYAAALLSVLGWGSLYSAAKPALREVTPLMVAFARASIACAALSLLCCLRARSPRAGLTRLKREALQDVGGPLILGVISFAGTSLTAMYAQQLLPASINGLLNNLSPLWLAVYVTAAGRARHPALLLAGSALAVLGVAAVLLGDRLVSHLAGLSGEASLGAGVAVFGSMLIASSSLVARRVLAGRDALAVTAVATGWGALPLLAALLAGWGGRLPAYATTTTSTKALLLWLGTGSTAFNFSLWYFALAYLPVTRVAHFQYLVPPLSVALAIVLLKETTGPGLLIGTAAIVAGIALAQGGAEATPQAPECREQGAQATAQESLRHLHQVAAVYQAGQRTVDNWHE